MRACVLLAIFACFLALAWSAAIEQVEDNEKVPANDLLAVDAGVESGDEKTRQARQFIAFGLGSPFGYYGRPYYGGYYGRPYYGGYYGRPYYGGYYRRPYYGGFYG
ncbi:uncharacterized protein LOC106083464 [Stomoxys calcitrans]|uniref:uncharacterized protein LOC106083464 n=1 Tax=Stomoxys calcitrans TaxID=35570 RepID=UPI0027E263F0|nr:uncharacterized protein LOC106083464 [Stomoxys calcitrans]